MGVFEGQVALITGGGTGIGAAAARQFCAAGGKVVLMGRRAGPLEAVAAPLGGLAVPGDAADAADVRQALAAARSAFGGVDVLLANAGGSAPGSVVDTDDESWARAMRVNLDTAFVCARESMPELLARKGSIVIVSSLAGHFAGPNVVGYVTTKHALIGLTRSLARDYGPQGVRVNAVSPGWVRTDLADRQMAALMAKHKLPDLDAAYALVTRDVPLRRAASADEVAQAALFLASSQASMISGVSLLVDGGASAVDLPTLAFTH